MKNELSELFTPETVPEKNAEHRNRSEYDDSEFLKEFRKAIAEKDITFFLQPQCRASNKKIVGAEALSRWIRKDGTIIPPSDFIPLLENNGFITELDLYIWESVAKWIHGWLEKGGILVPVSVNVSRVDIFSIDIPVHFKKLIERYDLPINAIKIEITESSTVNDLEKIRSVVSELHNYGFTVLMDDFGSGYSSLSTLYDIDMDVIKLDSLFLHFGSGKEEKGIHILESIVHMAKSVAIPVIVEGVETRQQAVFLKDIGCRYMQGYYFHKPMKLSDFEVLISDPDRIETAGLVSKLNEQFQVREFLDQTVYSDNMLNNILGAVALYSRHDEDVDIIRFNEQFYEEVNVPNFSDRLKGIQKYMPEKDAVMLKEALETAYDDRMNGYNAILGFYKPDGTLTRFLIHFYYLRSRNDTKIFYGSARNITQLFNLQTNMELISKFFSECLILLKIKNGKYSYDVVAQGIKELGFTKEELEAALFDGTIYSHVAPEYSKTLLRQCRDAIAGIDFSSYFAMYSKKGERLPFFIKTDHVDDESSDVKLIIMLSYRSSDI